MRPKDQSLIQGLMHSSDLNKDPALYKRGGKPKRKKRKSAPGRQGTTDYSDFSPANAPMEMSAVQYGFGGTLGSILKTAAPFASMIPGVGTAVGIGAGLAGSALESTDPDSATGGKFDIGDFIGSGIGGAMGGMGGMNPMDILKVGQGQNTFGKGGGIYIKPENRGKFTASANRAGHSVQEHARAVLTSPNATPLQKKRANFARNAAKWNHEMGGMAGDVQIEVEGQNRQEGIPIQMRKGELLVDKDGKTIRNFSAGMPHSKGGFPTMAPPESIVVPKKDGEYYDTLGNKAKRTYLKSLLSQQKRREENFMRKGGMVKMYQDGGTEPTWGNGYPDLAPWRLGHSGNPINLPEVNINGTAPGTPVYDWQQDIRGEQTANMMANRTNVSPVSKVPQGTVYGNRPSGTPLPDQLKGFNETQVDMLWHPEKYSAPLRKPNFQGEGSGWQKYASLAPAVYNAMQIFRKPEQIKKSDYWTNKINANLIRKDFEPINRTQAAMMSSIRGANYGAGTQAAQLAALGESQSQKAKYSLGVDNTNAEILNRIAAQNAQIEQGNRGMDWQTEIFNQQAKEQPWIAGKNLAENLGTFADNQAGIGFGYDQLEAAYPYNKDLYKRGRRRSQFAYGGAVTKRVPYIWG